MSANPPKNDAWGPYRDVRFVLVRQQGRLKPGRGLILEWRRQRSRWFAQVVWEDESLTPHVRVEWLERSRLVPVPVDPNWTGE